MVVFCCLLAASLFYTNKSHLLSGCTLQEVLCKQNTYFSIYKFGQNMLPEACVHRSITV